MDHRCEGPAGSPDRGGTKPDRPGAAFAGSVPGWRVSPRAVGTAVGGRMGAPLVFGPGRTVGNCRRPGRGPPAPVWSPRLPHRIGLPPRHVGNRAAEPAG